MLFKPTDYRDAYCGSYSCKRIHEYLSYSGSINVDTTNFNLIVSKNITDSILNIETLEKTFEVKLKSSKILGNHLHGKFSNDSIYFVSIPSMGPTSYKYIGKK